MGIYGSKCAWDIIWPQDTIGLQDIEKGMVNDQWLQLVLGIVSVFAI